MTLKKQRKDRHALNLLDWLLLFLALGGLLVAGWYVWHRRSAAENRMDILCVIRIPAMERSFLQGYGEDLIPGGSILRSENGTETLGYVQSVIIRDHMTTVLRNGEVVWENDPSLADVEVMVRMRATAEAGKGLRVGDLRIAAGGTGNFRFGNYFMAGTEILTVEVLES